MSRHRDEADDWPLVTIACPGGGRIRRGYEVSAVELARALARRDDLRVELLQGGAPEGDTAGITRRYPALDRYRTSTRRLAALTPFYESSLEHYSFGVAALPHLVRSRPRVVVSSERALANLLGATLHRVRPGTQVVLTNGGANRPPFNHVDAVIHHASEFHELAVTHDRGTAPGAARHVHIPIGFDIAPIDTRRADPAFVARSRAALGLPVDRPVIVSVGAVDTRVKRMDHVVTEVARLRDAGHDPYLVILGQRELETPDVERVARDRLGRSCVIRTVSPEEVHAHLDVADATMLASPAEGFGRVYIESIAHGVPCVLHDSPHMREILGVQGTYVDMTTDGAATAALRTLLDDPDDLSPTRMQERRDAMYERYSWDRILPAYLEAFGLGS